MERAEGGLLLLMIAQITEYAPQEHGGLSPYHKIWGQYTSHQGHTAGCVLPWEETQALYPSRAAGSLSLVQITVLPCMYVRTWKRTTLTILSRSKRVENKPPRNWWLLSHFLGRGSLQAWLDLFSRWQPPVSISKITQSLQVSDGCFAWHTWAIFLPVSEWQ